MEILYGPDFCINENTVVTIGKFDGIHIGHKQILKNLLEESKKTGFKSVVYTFLQNPKVVLGHEKFMPLMTNQEKTDELSTLGIDYLIYENFDEKFAMIEPEEFVKSVLVDKLSAKVVIMGKNSTFGKNRSGDINSMKKFGAKYNFEVKEVPMILNNGEIVSSSLIRQGHFK